MHIHTCIYYIYIYINTESPKIPESIEIIIKYEWSVIDKNWFLQIALKNVMFFILHDVFNMSSLPSYFRKKAVLHSLPYILKHICEYSLNCWCYLTIHTVDVVYRVLKTFSLTKTLKKGSQVQKRQGNMLAKSLELLVQSANLAIFRQ